MKKTSMISIFISTFFHLCCGCFGYAAFGDKTPGNLLTGFGFYEPYWLIDFANVCIILHLVGADDEPTSFLNIGRWFAERFPNRHDFYHLTCYVSSGYALEHYVATTTDIAIVFPYLDQTLGVIGALNYWPMSIYFPVEMYFVQRKIKAWRRKRIRLRIFSIGAYVLVFLLSSDRLKEFLLWSRLNIVIK